MKRIFLLLPLALALASCQANTTATSQTPSANAATPPNTMPTNPLSTSGDMALLTGFKWHLTDAKDKAGQRIDSLFIQEGKPVQLQFTDNRINVSNTCNALMGGYSLTDGKLQITQMASTMMACIEKPLMHLDDLVSQMLRSNPKITLMSEGAAPQLTLVSDNGDQWMLAGTPTVETRASGEVETVFLEIAPDNKPCSHPMIPNSQCMQVREIKFNESGIREGTPGEWENFYQTIEGFTHEEGTRNVVRVKRFKVANPPADGSSLAYVLDMVVESETVTPAKSS